MMNVGSISRACRGVLIAVGLFVLTACSDPVGQSAGAAGEQGDAGSGSGQLTGQWPGTPLEAPAVADQQGAEGAATANSDSDVDQAIDMVLGGDHKDYRDVIERLQSAVAAGDKESVAALVSYPIEVKISGNSQSITNASEFVASWDSIVTADIAQVVTTQKYSELFVNAQGVMFGDGEVWISGVCRDEACTTSDILITAIQSVSR